MREKENEEKSVWIRCPNGSQIKLYIPNPILKDIMEDFWKKHPDEDFDTDYMEIRVVIWSGIMKEIKMTYDENWEYYLPFELYEDYAVAVDSILR